LTLEQQADVKSTAQAKLVRLDNRLGEVLSMWEKMANGADSNAMRSSAHLSTTNQAHAGSTSTPSSKRLRSRYPLGGRKSFVDCRGAGNELDLMNVIADLRSPPQAGLSGKKEISRTSLVAALDLAKEYHKYRRGEHCQRERCGPMMRR